MHTGIPHHDPKHINQKQRGRLWKKMFAVQQDQLLQNFQEWDLQIYILTNYCIPQLIHI